MQDGHGSAVGLDSYGDQGLVPQQLAWNTNGQRGYHSNTCDKDVSGLSSDELPVEDYDDEDYAESRDHKRHKRHHEDQQPRPRYESAMTAKLRSAEAATRSTSPSRGNSDEDSCHEDDSDQGNGMLLALVPLARTGSCRSLQQRQRFLSLSSHSFHFRGLTYSGEAPKHCLFLPSTLPTCLSGV